MAYKSYKGLEEKAKMFKIPIENLMITAVVEIFLFILIAILHIKMWQFKLGTLLIGLAFLAMLRIIDDGSNPHFLKSFLSYQLKQRKKISIKDGKLKTKSTAIHT